MTLTQHWKERRVGAPPAGRVRARQPRDPDRAAALEHRAPERRLGPEPRAHEGAGRGLGDAERDVLRGRAFIWQRARPRPAGRRRCDGACASACSRRRHRRAPRHVLQPVRRAAMDARRPHRGRHADARAGGDTLAEEACACTRWAAPGSTSTRAGAARSRPGKARRPGGTVRRRPERAGGEIGGIESLLTMLDEHMVYAVGRSMRSREHRPRGRRGCLDQARGIGLCVSARV